MKIEELIKKINQKKEIIELLQDYYYYREDKKEEEADRIRETMEKIEKEILELIIELERESRYYE